MSHESCFVTSRTRTGNPSSPQGGNARAAARPRQARHPAAVLELGLDAARSARRPGAGGGAIVFRWLIKTFTLLLSGHADYSLAGHAAHPGLPVLGRWFVIGVLGVDPSSRTSRRGPRGLSGPVISVLEVAVTAPFHAFFGVVVMMSTTLLVGFYSMPIPGWQVSPLSDQATGGGIAWSFTELPTLLVLMALIVKWHKSQERTIRATERRQARGGDTELVDYNSYLQSLDRAKRVQR
jgi:hypothetical protein